MSMHHPTTRAWLGLITAGLVLLAGCSKKNYSPTGPPASDSAPAALGKAGNLPGFAQKNLVADNSSFGAKRVDPNLVNGWGINEGSDNNFWISANGANLSVVYDQQGHTAHAPVSIPTVGGGPGGDPSGNVFNNTADFVLSGNGAPAKFLFAGEDGVITGWNTGNAAVVVADRSQQGAVFKGIAIASMGGNNFIYATDFHNRAVDVFDKNFNFVSATMFVDPNLPADYGPFNIRLINGNLYVTYAELKPPDNHDDLAGAGHGYVDVYSTSGTLLSRFASQGTLNSPWGLIPVNGIQQLQNTILISNFGDGKINAFSTDGTFLGQLKDQKGNTIAIDGLWGLGQLSGADQPTGRIYFTAGPNGESDGLFGYLHTNGND